MRKIIICLIILSLCSSGLWAQDEMEKETSVLIAPEILGLIFGYFKINFEIPFEGGLALEIEPAYYNIKSSPLLAAALNDSAPDFNFWIGGGRVGANYYLSGDAPNGLFIGVFGNAGYLYVGTPASNFNGMQIGGGAKIGYRWVWDWFSLAPQIGIGYNKFMMDISSADINVLYRGAIEGPAYPISLGIALAF